MSPTCFGWQAKFTNGSVTDNGDGTCSVALSAASGDVTSVGDCASGACFDGTQGTTISIGTGDVADAGAIRLQNNTNIAWEANPTGVDLTLGVNTSNVLTSSAPISATTGFQIGGVATDDSALIGNGTNFVATAVTNCTDTSGNHLNYTAASNAFSCGTSVASHTHTFTLAGDTGSDTVTVGGGTETIAGGTAMDTSESADTVTVSWDSTEVEATTWGAGGNASNAWTFNLSGTDPIFTAVSGGFSITGTGTFSGLVAANANLTVGNGATGPGEIRWLEDTDNGSNYISFIAPSAITSNVTITLEDDANPIPNSAVGDGTAEVKEYFWPCPALLPLEAADSIPPLGKDAGTALDMLNCGFDDSTDEGREVVFKVPSDVNTSGTVTFRMYWYSAAATSGNVIMDFRDNGGTAAGTDPDQTLTVNASAASATAGTAGQLNVTSWTQTVTTLAWAANDLVIADFERDANNGSDTLVGDALVIGYSVEIPRN